jgi:RNA polymerase sigma factor (sigma-70 family)
LEIQEIPIVASSIYSKRTDPELVAMCLEGDALAWETLIMRYRRFIYAIPVRFGFGSADAADIFQNVCVKLIEHLHEIKDESRLSAWLATITSRQCLSVRFFQQREVVTADDDFGESVDPATSLEEIRILGEHQQQIRDCVDELPDRCRLLIQMLYLDARSPSYQEISDATGIPTGSIAPSRVRCLEKLKRILARRGIK